MPNGQTLTIDGPPDTYPIAGIYSKVYQAYPHIKKECVVLANKNKVLDPKKSIKDYGITYNNCDVSACIPEYFFGSQGLVKLMKVDGSWDYNQQMVSNLQLSANFQAKMQEYNNNQKKSMTAVVVAYLETTYANEKDELKLVLQKARKFLKK